MTAVLSLDWWLLPLSGSSTHYLPEWAVWHARTMVLGWALLMPVGALAARYWKVTARQNWPHTLDNKRWWRIHQFCQYGACIAVVAGAALAWNQGSGSGASALWHHWLGWGITAIAALQVASGLVRGTKGGPTEPQLRGDHYDMTAHRRWFERWHKSVGWLLLAVAIAVIALGLVAADAPRWMPAVLALWWLTLAGLAWRWQAQGRCTDTYAAIWGPDPEHPGNQLTPIGWGIRRLGAPRRPAPHSSTL